LYFEGKVNMSNLSNCSAARSVVGLRHLIVSLILVSLATLPLVASQVYVATNNGDFADYNTLTGTYTLLGTNATVLWGMGYSSGLLYANDNNGSPNVGFYTVNPANGALTTVADMTGSTSGTGTLTAPIGGGTLYYFDHSNQLFTVNPSTGAATTIGALGFSVGGTFDLDFAPNGQLYATSNGNFYQVNTSTGAGTLLGNSGTQLQALVAGDGNLYGFSGTNMYSIDLTDGALTFVRSTPSVLGNFDDGTPVLSTPTPEPGTLLMLATGALAAAGAFRRKFKL
jgi:PEP-CTERM motif